MNKAFSRFQAVILGFIMVLSSSQAFSWGAKGHEIVAGVGASLSGVPFFTANQATAEQLSTVPDRVWKATSYAQESPNHWFQGDAYTSNIGLGSLAQFPRGYSQAVSKMGERVIVKNGTAPWRINQFYALALAAIRKGDAKSAMVYVGVMSHYVGDISQPLHVSENYDGVLTGQKGIHKFFETDNIVDMVAIQKQVSVQAQALLHNPNYMKLMGSSLIESNFSEIERALMFRDKVLSTDKQLGRTGRGAAIQLQLAIARMADGAATYAVILNHLWQEAQGKMGATQVSVGDPAFINVDFSQLFLGIEMMTPVKAGIDDEEDCSLR